MGRFLFRLGGLTARHRIVVIVVWIGLAALALGLVKAYGAKTDNGLTLPGTDSQAAFDILAQRFPPQQNGTNPFVFAVEEGELTDPANRAADRSDVQSHRERAAGLQRCEPPHQGRQDGWLVVQGRADRLHAGAAQGRLRLHHRPTGQRDPGCHRTGDEGRDRGRRRRFDRQVLSSPDTRRASSSATSRRW